MPDVGSPRLMSADNPFDETAGGGVDFNLFTFNVRSFGAVGGQDSTAAFLAAFAAASATSGRAAVYMPCDTLPYIVTQGMPAFIGKAVAVYGDGPNATVIYHNTATVDEPFLQWQPAADQQTINFVVAGGFAILSTNSTRKKGIVSIGTSFGSHFHDIRIQLLTSGDVAHEIQGWDQTLFTNCFYQATHARLVKKCTVGLGAGVGQFDHFRFVGCQFWSSDDTAPLLDFESGVTWSRYTEIGSAWVGGSDAVRFVSTGQLNTVKFINCGWENGNVNGATPVLHGFYMDLRPAAGSHDLSVETSSEGSNGAQGVRLRNIARASFKLVNFENTWPAPHVIFDIDNSNDNITFENCGVFQDGQGTIAIGNQLVAIDGSPINSGLTPAFRASVRYAKRAADVNNQQQLLAGGPIWKGIPSEVVLAPGASLTCPSPGYMDTPDSGVTPYAQTRVFVDAQNSTFADATHEYGLFATYHGGIAALVVSANCAAGDVGGKLSVIYAGATNQLIVKNNLAVTVRVKVVID